MRLHQALKDVFLHLSSQWNSSFNECGKILIHVRIILLCIHNKQCTSGKNKQETKTFSHTQSYSPAVDLGLHFAILHTGGHCSGHPAEEMRQYPAELFF